MRGLLVVSISPDEPGATDDSTFVRDDGARLQQHVPEDRVVAVAGKGRHDVLDQLASVALAAGVTCAVAAGSDNLNACNYSPSRVKQALTLGASDDGTLVAECP